MIEYVLASGSPRRRDILTQLKIPFRVRTTEVSEEVEGVQPELWPRLLAERKALAVSKLEPKSPILGFDTLVTLDGTALGKPKNSQEALKMLTKLSDREHIVISGISIAYEGRTFCSADERTSVFFRHLSNGEMQDYINSGEPMDKAGAYGIQGLGARLVKSISGCYYNVVGLPVAKTLELLALFEGEYATRF